MPWIVRIVWKYLYARLLIIFGFSSFAMKRRLDSLPREEEKVARLFLLSFGLLAIGDSFHILGRVTIRTRRLWMRDPNFRNAPRHCRTGSLSHLHHAGRFLRRWCGDLEKRNSRRTTAGLRFCSFSPRWRVWWFSRFPATIGKAPSPRMILPSIAISPSGFKAWRGISLLERWQKIRQKTLPETGVALFALFCLLHARYSLCTRNSHAGDAHAAKDAHLRHCSPSCL